MAELPHAGYPFGRAWFFVKQELGDLPKTWKKGHI